MAQGQTKGEYVQSYYSTYTVITVSKVAC